MGVESIMFFGCSSRRITSITVVLRTNALPPVARPPVSSSLSPGAPTPAPVTPAAPIAPAPAPVAPIAPAPVGATEEVAPRLPRAGARELVMEAVRGV